MQGIPDLVRVGSWILYPGESEVWNEPVIGRRVEKQTLGKSSQRAGTLNLAARDILEAVRAVDILQPNPPSS